MFANKKIHRHLMFFLFNSNSINSKSFNSYSFYRLHLIDYI